MPTPRLLVSLFNAEEVRVAIAGGAEVIDCEDARVKVGMFKPRTISDIAYAVRQNEGAHPRRHRISANIGFGLLFYGRSGTGYAVARTLEEIQAKAAQEALGIAAAMDSGDQRPNIVKFGIDGLRREQIRPVVEAVKNAMTESHCYEDHQVICGILETDRKEWEKRKTNKSVISGLLTVGEFYFDPKGNIDIRTYFDERTAQQMMHNAGSDQPMATLIDPYDPNELGLPDDQAERLELLVREIAEAGADGIMIDTPVSAKYARICLVKHKKNAEDYSSSSGLTSHGVFELDFLREHSERCAYHFCESWLAGSIQPYHAAELGRFEHLDVVLCRGAASASNADLFPNLKFAGEGQRFERRIREDLVRRMAQALKGG